MWDRILDAISCAFFPAAVIWAPAAVTWRGELMKFDDPERERNDW